MPPSAEFLGRRLRIDEQRDVLQDVGLDRVEVLHDLWQVGKALSAVLDRLRDREACGFAIELAHRVALLPLEARQGAQRLLEILFQFLDRRLYHCCCSAGQALNSAGGTTWPSFIGAIAKPIGVRRIAMPLAVALSRSAVKARSLGAADLLNDAGAALLVVVALERRRQRDLQVVDQVVERLVQRRRPAGAAAQSPRADAAS